MSILPLIGLQIIVFGAVIFFLKKILYRDTESSINRLDRVYQDMLKKQKDLGQKIEAAEKEYNEKKEEASLVASKLKTEALDEVRKKQDEIIKKAKTEADAIVQKAHDAENKFNRGLEKHFTKNTIDHSVTLLGSAFNEKIIKALHTQFVGNFMERLKDFNLTGVGPHINKITIKSALANKKEELSGIKAMVEQKLGRPVEIEEMVDKNMIVGIMLEFGTLLLDDSLLNHIKEAAENYKKKIDLED